MSLAPLSRTVVTLMRATFSLPLEDTLLLAAAKLRENGSDVLPITDGPYLRGVVTEFSLATALAEGADEKDGIERALAKTEPIIRTYETGAEALRKFEELGVGTLVVVDDDRRLLGLLRASDLISPPKTAARVANVGGMATPFGVYLTSGTVSAGAGGWALVTTGMTLFTILITATLLSVYFGNWLVKVHVSDLWATLISSALQWVLFGVGFRILPISGIHAAEHMVVHAIERGEPLVPSVVKRMPRVHPRCGTNLAAGSALYMGIATATTIIADDWLRLMTALVVTLLFWRRLGGLMQYWITTRPPTDKHIRMGIRSAEELLAKQANAHHVHVGFFGRVWNSGLLHVIAGSSIVFGVLQGLSALFHWNLPIE